MTTTARVAASAGPIPKTSAVTTASRSVKPTTRASGLADNVCVVGSPGSAARRRRPVHIARAMPTVIEIVMLAVAALMLLVTKVPVDEVPKTATLRAGVVAVIGIFGLVLSSVGLAGMTAYAVAQRGREIGIRMALGARKGDVLGLVMKQGMLLATVGTSIGLAGACTVRRA